MILLGTGRNLSLGIPFLRLDSVLRSKAALDFVGGTSEYFRMLRWFLIPFLAAAAHAQVYEGKPLVTASLVADTTAIVPGRPFEVGLLLEMAPKWHTYWEYSGDAGIPTSVDWTLPKGFGSGPIQWPLPHRLVEPGDIEVYAYGDKVLLITTIVPPADLAETTVALRAKASWLVCEEICIPGSAEVELTLPVGDAASAAPANEVLFETFRRQLPSANAPPFGLSWTSGPDGITLSVEGLGDATAVELFPLPAPGQQVDHPRTGPLANGSATVTVKTQGPLRGVLMVESPAGRKGWFVSSEETQRTAGPPARASASGENPGPRGGTRPALGLWKALLFGFLGGLILNLMPCVLPVISLKIFGFVRQAGDHPGRILRHGVAFVAGIFAWFLGLALLIIALKAAGNEVTWAFQFQNPWFNLIIGSVVFVFALNLFGVFEIVLPGQASNALAEASGGEGYAGSFAQGVFATLLATPCTAPFLGTALGFAFSQPAPVILAVFAAVSFGMGAPYLLLSARPGWMKILPRPGVWMERVKQFMGFPLMATLLWMLFILGNQKGIDAVIWTGAFLLCLAVACWIYGAFCGPLTPPPRRLAALAAVAFFAVGGGWHFLGKFASSTRTESAATAADGIAWQPFSQKALDALLAEGRPVFVDFTADWCISCKFNERTAINVPAVRAVFAESGIVPMKADWTNANPEITAALAKFGRVGVPFYVLYPAGRPDAPVTLPEILTEQIVLDALAKARP